MRTLPLAIVLLVLATAVVPARAEDATPRLYITTDKTRVVDLAAPISAVSVANPAIADLHVLTPTRILVNGKTPGTTSLLVVSGATVQEFDLVVQPGPIDAASAAGPAAPHSVLVQRAGDLSTHLFVPDGDRAWVELGTVKPEIEAKKK